MHDGRATPPSHQDTLVSPSHGGLTKLHLVMFARRATSPSLHPCSSSERRALLPTHSPFLPSSCYRAALPKVGRIRTPPYLLAVARTSLCTSHLSKDLLELMLQMPPSHGLFVWMVGRVWLPKRTRPPCNEMPLLHRKSSINMVGLLPSS